MAKIPFSGQCRLSDAVLARHRKYSNGLGFQMGSKPVSASLAVVGGGPDVALHVEELRAWDGEVWAIGRSFQWCRSMGIDATYYGIDPNGVDPGQLDGVRRAVLADITHPAVLEALQENGAAIEIANIGKDAILHDTSAAGTSPMIAAHRGHKHVTLFGVALSFSDKPYVYGMPMVTPSRLWVQCGGQEYVTTPQYIMQAEFISELARGLPEFITVRGRGFLPALIEHGNYAVTHVSRDIHNSLKAA